VQGVGGRPFAVAFEGMAFRAEGEGDGAIALRNLGQARELANIERHSIGISSFNKMPRKGDLPLRTTGIEIVRSVHLVQLSMPTRGQRENRPRRLSESPRSVDEVASRTACGIKVFLPVLPMRQWASYQRDRGQLLLSEGGMMRARTVLHRLKQGGRNERE